MLARLKRIKHGWAEWQRFRSLPDRDREIVFYAEGGGDWPHFAPVVEALTGKFNREICYLTSAEDDPVFALRNKRIKCFCIGPDPTRALVFAFMQARIFVMTTPDLDSLHLRRSVHPVHYLYIFHALNSTHMVYRKGAFDAYDTILCPGPPHKEEIRRTEREYNLKEKRLVEHGYGRLDAMLENSRSENECCEAAPESGRRLLLGPSWGQCSFIEDPCGRELIETLLAGGHRLDLRLHPMTVRRFPMLAKDLERDFGSTGRFRVITDMSEKDSFYLSELLITDWSGTAYEYAYTRERPVLFLNTPRKVNNPEYTRIDLVPLEVSIRNEIGEVLELSQIVGVAQVVDRLCANIEAFRKRIQQSREQCIYNVGNSGERGAEAIIDALEQFLQAQAENAD